MCKRSGRLGAGCGYDRRIKGFLAHKRPLRTVPGMAFSSCPRHRPAHQSSTSIDELLTLSTAHRLQLLRDLQTGEPVPRVIIQVPVLVRSLSFRRADQEQ